MHTCSGLTALINYNLPVSGKPGQSEHSHYTAKYHVYPTSFKMQEGGKGSQTGSIHQYVTRLVDRSQHTCSLNE
ncbi:hypothetical protein AYY18_08690 [Morganella psychrotolerans]|uniref:Uncharacterized protein n=1 Tax=Morganella psychrotolerans TaxID=368603 RepID=A0A1B8H7U7_9GAMM|nr:hypothetical protein AYY18_08690 [Morganella psychrotolerans]